MRNIFDRWSRPTAAAAAALALLCGATGCEPDNLPTVIYGAEAEAETEYAELPVLIDVAAGYGETPTKASLLGGAELKRSGALLLVYRSGTRQLDTYRYFTAAELDAAGTVPLTVSAPMTDCDFYLLGNLHGIHRTTGAAADLMEALGTDFPMDEGALESFVYRLDGGALNGNWRRETMAEVQTYGLPYACVEKGVDVRRCAADGKSVPQKKANWLFSKVVIKVDHRLFDGGDASKLDYFVNRELYIRQANLRLLPFSDGAVKAAEAADSGTGDYDAAMSNAAAGEYVFYVPENMQGTVAGITSGAGKNKDNIAGIPAAVRDYATYVEFRGTVDKAAGGFGGDVTYQFYLGGNETSDFNLRRGSRYNVTLSFTAGALFGPPEWKVNPELADSRLFRLTADAEFTTDIGDVNASRTLAVRKNRPGRFYLYMNPSGNSGAANSLIGKACEDPSSFVMDDLSDCAWYGDLMMPGTADAGWLAERGIRAAWDASGASLTFSVEDPAKFEGHMGESRGFELRLLPGGTIRSEFKIRLTEDLTLTVADGKSLTDEFYLGQKRSVSVSGFSGTDIRYAAVQERCGAGASSDKNANVQWKSGGSAADPFPKCALDRDGNLSLDPGNSVYASQRMTGGRLDIYAFYPNRFQSSHGWTSKNGRLIIFSEDFLNDSLEAEVRISEPSLKTQSASESAYKAILPIDGTPVDAGFDFNYRTYDGKAALEKSGFDAALYDALLAFSLESTWAEYIGIDYDGSRIYCKKTTGTAKGDLEKLNYLSTGQTNILTDHTFYVRGNPATGLFPATVYRCSFDFSKLAIVKFGTDGTKWSSDNVFDMRYFIEKTALTDGVDVLTEDESFEIYVNYYFPGSDISTLEITRTGQETRYTCRNNETFGPMLELIVDTFDNGSPQGGQMRWRYDESHQVMKSSTGEPVPGGLLLPYGEQTVTFKYENRWDHRAFTETASLEMRYHTSFCAFVGATRRENAQVFIVPTKNVKYLLRCGADATLAQRSWMTRLFGHRNWSGHISVKQAYVRKEGGFYKYYTPSQSFPLEDFSCTYLPSYSGSTWSDAAVRALDNPVQGSTFRKLMLTELLTEEGYENFAPGLYQRQLVIRSNPVDGDFNYIYGMYVDTNEVFAN